MPQRPFQLFWQAVAAIHIKGSKFRFPCFPHYCCLLLGLIAAVCAAPVPIRRSTDIKVSITFVHNPASGNESLDKDRLLGWAQSVIDQQKSTLGLPDGVKILAKDVPQSQQDRIHFSVEGGTVCSITQACDVEFGEGSGTSSKDTLSATITQRSKQLFSGPVQLQNYDASRFIS
ncbi:hypothetical protein F5878DRAFT_627697 [Lentinula raphanica]|uniref:Uncharacterized protein n=1 Tax=Lentinula raphanica TaxID=153919 RepID=A0AA38UB80_9AGAR|nr:hypothetical protein F5878DRAFT_627697 [Lentinula raphanica]